MADASQDPQLQSAFIARLPQEVRDAIYLELWRSCGLRQHILWHDIKEDKTKSHFCRWECITPFDVQDKLQEDIDATRIQLGVPLGESFSNKTYALRLFSAWNNHWPCGERLAEVHGEWMHPGVRLTTSLGPCWSSRRDPASDPPSSLSLYLSMLLTCKIISSECLKSIYRSTTFIFTDVYALNLFVGFCKVLSPMENWPKMGVPPPGFRTHGRHMELSLHPVFSMQLACTSPTYSPLPEERHNPLDFHALRLDLIENLTTLDIWVAARCIHPFVDRQDASNLDQDPYKITDLSVEKLRDALLKLDRVENLTISMPLTQCTEPEDGYIGNAGLPPRFRVWRRGAGDRYHPVLLPVYEKERLSSNVNTSEQRYVRADYDYSYRC
ncbi:hypothetical protein F66182_7103 [Fusarium sp. NRRL 66182]|nr:hypothetical protein F66182_7103 [Fusarium sp. NRRL 66182]